MQSIGFEGTTVTVPKSDAVHFDFRDGSLFLVFTGFTGEVQLSGRKGELSAKRDRFNSLIYATRR
jgi:hypothetical protein